ncbi:hypothetical protein [Victivallis sp. Marseille-Q1083]|uniref:hypothetical protein n=1 Tax=Victivallis sp. Marseille-Q1083 TaxID=2717288 RepID=UPI00158E1F1E|nr:hypothetical protein [Victivallis sp. Marseille-Q1083]
MIGTLKLFCGMVTVLLLMAAGRGETAGEPDGKALLAKSFAVSPQFSYIAEVERLDLHNPALTAKYFRQVDPDGQTRQRLEFYEQGHLKETYIQNDSGQYGIIDGVAAAIHEVLILARPEVMETPLNKAEFYDCRFTATEDSYRSIPCYRITVTDPDDTILVASMSQVPLNEVENAGSEFNKRRPFIRDFWVGREDNILYCRRHYNRAGKLIYEAERGKLEKMPRFQPDWFATPENLLSPKLLSRLEFQRRGQTLQVQAEEQRRKALKSGRFFTRLASREGLMTFLSPALLVFGAVAFVGLAIVKWRAVRRSKDVVGRRRH